MPPAGNLYDGECSKETLRIDSRSSGFVKSGAGKYGFANGFWLIPSRDRNGSKQLEVFA